jgi:hypothetical protein
MKAVIYRGLKKYIINNISVNGTEDDQSANEEAFFDRLRNEMGDCHFLITSLHAQSGYSGEPEYAEEFDDELDLKQVTVN